MGQLAADGPDDWRVVEVAQGDDDEAFGFSQMEGS